MVKLVVFKFKFPKLSPLPITLNLVSTWNHLYPFSNCNVTISLLHLERSSHIPAFTLSMSALTCNLAY